ncbi:hypothetical protein HYV10_01930 [Candidatus Dependentiae bacterium]|nr:hypothetical protein [Candidatus Dependentiae bacterium]
MFKRIFFVTILGLIAFPEKALSLDTNSKAAICATSFIVLGGTAIYWAKRESNDSLIEQAKLLIEENKRICVEAEMCINQNSSCLSSSSLLTGLQGALESLQEKLLALKKKLELVNVAIGARYDSYLTPWNWSDKMLQASNQIKTALEMNNVVDINLQLLLGRVNYLYCLKKYNRVLESIQKFIYENKVIYQNKSPFEEIDSLQELCKSAESIRLGKTELDQFFLQYEQLDSELKQIIHSLNIGDRNQELEVDFHDLWLRVNSLYNILNQHMKYLSNYLKYKESIANVNNEQFLIKEIRKFIGGSSSYPLKDFMSQLNSDINYLKNTCAQQAVYRQTILVMLQEVKDCAIVSNEYVLELRAYELYLQQKLQLEAEREKAEAAKRQAQAAQDAASAAFRQVWATEEQNRLLREKNRLQEEQNRIERERNELERRKQQSAQSNDDTRW